MADLLEKLTDLHKQATEERSHHYTGAVIAEAIAEITRLRRYAPSDPEAATIADYEDVLADHRRLVRELDVALNGKEGAAKQASLCDIVAQVKHGAWKLVKPPADFLDRLRLEQSDNADRWAKLTTFIVGDAFKSLDEEQRELLSDQARVMELYGQILAQRIRRIEAERAKTEIDNG